MSFMTIWVRKKHIFSLFDSFIINCFNICAQLFFNMISLTQIKWELHHDYTKWIPKIYILSVIWKYLIIKYQKGVLYCISTFFINSASSKSA